MDKFVEVNYAKSASDIPLERGIGKMSILKILYKPFLCKKDFYALDSA